MDAIHTTDGKDVILEINDTASGLYKDNEKEDMGYIRCVASGQLVFTLSSEI